MSESKSSKDLARRDNNQSINHLRVPAEAITKAVINTKIEIDNTVYECNLRGKLEKVTARVRIEADDDSPYKFLL
jgi:hypothetical protein